MPKNFKLSGLAARTGRAAQTGRAGLSRAADTGRAGLSRAAARGRALPRQRRFALAGVGALSAATLAFTVVPAGGETVAADASSTAQLTYRTEPIKDVRASVTDQLAGASVKIEAIQAKKQAAADARKAKTEAKQQAVAKAAAKAAAERKAEQQSPSRSAQRPQSKPAAAPTYPNNLDGWIRESLDIMDSKGIPGSYDGLHRNILRESSGNPNAINNWDINAINGIPSKGLLQVIPPTFAAYHVSGTPKNIYDPIANIVAAANYAADRYGSIDNVFGAY
ncbi:transglycosylase SLT domain-containing protein [Streptomyces sp. NPDC056716]|uniref:transglycosylase SLT domain-containing protein n=1 Tax=unclassified Streptomyces TaxID=2593676 RepID=UPI00368D71BF